MVPDHSIDRKVSLIHDAHYGTLAKIKATYLTNKCHSDKAGMDLKINLIHQAASFAVIPARGISIVGPRRSKHDNYSQISAQIRPKNYEMAKWHANPRLSVTDKINLTYASTSLPIVNQVK